MLDLNNASRLLNNIDLKAFSVVQCEQIPSFLHDYLMTV